MQYFKQKAEGEKVR